MKKVVWLLCVIFVLGISVVLLFYFGNPQWHKYCYMWQAYIIENQATQYENSRYIKRPKKYTGVCGA